MRRRRGIASVSPRASGIARLLKTAAKRSEFDASARAVGAPVLVLHAADDHFVPLDFAEAAARRYGWTFETLPRGGHYPHRDSPDEWAAVVSPWLAAHLEAGEAPAS
jgi:pimeloyl-ACP methyl ester carboxylesterase